jgi:chromosome segregation ATPase
MILQQEDLATIKNLYETSSQHMRNQIHDLENVISSMKVENEALKSKNSLLEKSHLENVSPNVIAVEIGVQVESVDKVPVAREQTVNGVSENFLLAGTSDSNDEAEDVRAISSPPVIPPPPIEDPIIEELKTKVKELEDELHHKDDQLRVQIVQLQTLQGSVSELRSSYDLLREQKKALQAKLDSQPQLPPPPPQPVHAPVHESTNSSILSTTSSHTFPSQKKIHRYENQIQDLLADLTLRTQERDDALLEAQSIQLQLHSKSQQCDKLQGELFLLMEKLELYKQNNVEMKLQERSENMSAEFNMIENESSIQTITRQYEIIEKYNYQLKEYVKTCEEKLNMSDEMIAYLRGDHDSLKTTCEKFTQQVISTYFHLQENYQHFETLIQQKLDILDKKILSIRDVSENTLSFNQDYDPTVDMEQILDEIFAMISNQDPKESYPELEAFFQRSRIFYSRNMKTIFENIAYQLALEQQAHHQLHRQYEELQSEAKLKLESHTVAEDDLRQQYMLLQEMSEHYKQLLTKLTEEKVDLQNEVMKLKSSEYEHEIQRKNLQESLDSIESELYAKNSQCISLEEKCSTIKEEYDEQLAQYQQQIHELQEERKQLQGEVKDLQHSVESSEQSLTSSSQRLAQYQLQMHEQELLSHEAQLKYSQLEERYYDVKSQYEILSENYHKLKNQEEVKFQAQLAYEEKFTSSLVKEHEELRHAYEQLQQSYNHDHRLVDDYKMQLLSAQSISSDQQQRLQDLERDYQDLHQKYTAIFQEKSKLQELLHGKNDEVTKHQSLYIEFENQVKAFTDKIQAIEKSEHVLYQKMKQFIDSYLSADHQYPSDHHDRSLFLFEIPLQSLSLYWDSCSLQLQEQKSSWIEKMKQLQNENTQLQHANAKLQHESQEMRILQQSHDDSLQEEVKKFHQFFQLTWKSLSSQILSSNIMKSSTFEPLSLISSMISTQEKDTYALIMKFLNENRKCYGIFFHLLESLIKDVQGERSQLKRLEDSHQENRNSLEVIKRQKHEQEVELKSTMKMNHELSQQMKELESLFQLKMKALEEKYEHDRKQWDELNHQMKIKLHEYSFQNEKAEEEISRLKLEKTSFDHQKQLYEDDIRKLREQVAVPVSGSRHFFMEFEKLCVMISSLADILSHSSGKTLDNIDGTSFLSQSWDLTLPSVASNWNMANYEMKMDSMMKRVQEFRYIFKEELRMRKQFQEKIIKYEGQLESLFQDIETKKRELIRCHEQQKLSQEKILQYDILSMQHDQMKKENSDLKDLYEKEKTTRHQLQHEKLKLDNDRTEVRDQFEKKMAFITHENEKLKNMIDVLHQEKSKHDEIFQQLREEMKKSQSHADDMIFKLQHDNEVLLKKYESCLAEKTRYSGLLTEQREGLSVVPANYEHHEQSLRLEIIKLQQERDFYQVTFRPLVLF